MFASLRGGPLVAVTAVVVAIIGAVTALTWNGNLTGSDFLTIIVPVVVGATGVTSAHVAGQAVGVALQTPPPVSGPEPVPATAPAPAPATEGGN